MIQSPIPRAAAAATTIVANVFDGGPKTSVTLRIGGGAPLPMTRTRRPDPFVDDVFTRNEAVKKSWIKAEPSSHIWTARLPTTIAAGTHRMTVTAITEYGDSVSGTIALEITG